MISAKPWSGESVVMLFAGVLATYCTGILVAWSLEALHAKMSADQLQFVQTVTIVMFVQVAALVWTGIFLRLSNISWSEAFGLRPRSRIRAIGLGFAAGALALPLMWALQWLSQALMEWLHLNPVAQAAVAELQNTSLTAPEKIAFGVFTVLLAPIAEETLFRGILYPSVKQSGRPRLALWGTSALFGVMHFNMASLVPLIFFGVVLVFLYEYSESLLTPIAAHGIFNAANFFYLIFPDAINHWLHLS